MMKKRMKAKVNNENLDDIYDDNRPIILVSAVPNPNERFIASPQAEWESADEFAKRQEMLDMLSILFGWDGKVTDENEVKKEAVNDGEIKIHIIDPVNGRRVISENKEAKTSEELAERQEFLDIANKLVNESVKKEL